MIIKIIAIVIGVLILGAGLYYLSKEKHDPESKKIYGVISAVGAVIAVAAAILFFFPGPGALYDFLAAPLVAHLPKGATLIAADGRATGAWWDGQPFQRILLDAPC